MKFVPKGTINSVPALVQKMAWRRPGDKPLFESMMVSLSFLNTKMAQVWLKPFLVEDKDWFIYHSQYHGCWCPGNTRSQSISSCGIDLVKP